MKWPRVGDRVNVMPGPWAPNTTYPGEVTHIDQGLTTIGVNITGDTGETYFIYPVWPREPHTERPQRSAWYEPRP